MKNILLLFLFTILGFPSVVESTKTSGKSDNKCYTSALDLILETYDKGHPYRDVNLKRERSFWNVYNQRIKIGNPNNYRLGDNIGKGKFAKVFKGIYGPTQDPIAIKIILHGMEEKILREIQILEELKDAPNFLPVRDVIREQQEPGKIRMALVFDLLQTPYYRDFYPGLSRYQVKSCIYETLRTLEYAHSKGVMHRDIKPLNILMDQDQYNFKVIDWGHSDFYLPGMDYSVRVATIHYKGPELILNYTKHDYSLDIWSTGVLLASMAFKKLHFFQANPEPNMNDPTMTPEQAKMVSFRAQLDAIAQVLGTTKLKQYVDKFKDDMDLTVMNDVGNYGPRSFRDYINESNAHMMEPALIDLLDKMLVYDHTKRPTAQVALNHAYFNEVREKIANGTHYPKKLDELRDDDFL